MGESAKSKCTSNNWHTWDNILFQRFECVIRPLMNENGTVNGEKLSQLIEAKFNKQIPIGDFRLVDVSRAIEPWLMTLGAFLQ